jgi:hypothetical protein
MRSISTTIAITAAGLLLFSQFAQASDVEAELRQMQERIADLENQLEEDETDSFFPTQEEAGSALSSMLEDTDMGGWVAASYNYNFEGQHNGATTTANDTLVPLLASSHSETNTFQLDQAWISLDNAATEESRGGFHLDYEWGNVNAGGGGGALYSGYVSYLAPLGNGINLDVGLMPTLIGAEVAQTNANFNVTRGFVWSMQPVTNVGAVVSTSVTDDISIALGVLNDPFAAPIVDTNNEKAITAQIAWAGEGLSISGQIVWGEESPGVDTGIYDIVISGDVSEDISAWFNYTIRSTDDGPLDGEYHGIAAAARMALSDEMGVALRGEIVIIDVDAGETELYSVTVTTDYALTDHLTGKGEVRINFSGDDVYPGSRVGDAEDVSAMVLAQLIYQF